MVLPVWPDAEELVMALLRQAPALAPTVTQTTPPNLGDNGPVIQVLRVGGTDDGITDRPLVEVAVFAPSYKQAIGIAEQVRQRMLGAGGTRVPTPTYPDGVLVDRCVTATSPQEVPYDNPELRRKLATYQVELRRPRS
ncbi:phage tail termination protein [Saccharothrix coeruleofusca]|uniref:phage tail termination protein n=1 Tax=Saccharothrix coeruleofusca TaxID=33919 RepID=UPI003FD897BF